ncbi:NUDIX domain-containing protein [Streptomyces sp. NPDC058646]|uniref:NUDIX domain-containing protein n=1 Tax=Streptomyces sp. NPDC058646 TaxID=3346574 RepID=UPI003666B9C9
MSGPQRHREPVDVHLILRRDTDTGPEVLLSRRAGDVYASGMWHLVSGHIDGPHEDMRTALIREAQEEAGITIDPAQVRYALTVHHRGPGRPKPNRSVFRGHRVAGHPRSPRAGRVRRHGLVSPRRPPGAHSRLLQGRAGHLPGRRSDGPPLPGTRRPDRLHPGSRPPPCPSLRARTSRPRRTRECGAGVRRAGRRADQDLDGPLLDTGGQPRVAGRRRGRRRLVRQDPSKRPVPPTGGGRPARLGPPPGRGRTPPGGSRAGAACRRHHRGPRRLPARRRPPAAGRAADLPPDRPARGRHPRQRPGPPGHRPARPPARYCPWGNSSGTWTARACSSLQGTRSS